MPAHKYCIGTAVPRPTAVPVQYLCSTCEIVRSFCVEGGGGEIKYRRSGGHAICLSKGSIQVTAVGGRLSQSCLRSIPSSSVSIPSSCVGGVWGEFSVNYVSSRRYTVIRTIYVVKKRQTYLMLLECQYIPGIRMHFVYHTNQYKICTEKQRGRVTALIYEYKYVR